MSAPASAPASAAGIGAGRSAALLRLLLPLLVAAAYAPLAPWIVERWRAPDGFFSHGPLVPFACAWLVWQRRRELAAPAAGTGDWRGLLLVVPALLLLVAATFARVDSPAAASLLLLLPGLVWLIDGPARLRALAAPLCFLAFAIPWPMELLANVVQSLKLFVVATSGALVNLFGAGVRSDGSFLVLPGGDRLLVDDECSGLKSALALLALGTFMALSARSLSRRQRLLLFLLALPVALGANVLRVALLALVGRAWGSAAVGALAHADQPRRLRGGDRRLRPARAAAAPRREGGRARAAARRAAGGLPVTGARLGIALLLLGASAASTLRLHRPGAAPSVHLLADAPHRIAGWSGRDLALDERQYELLESRDVLYRSFRSDAGDVLACVAVAGPQNRAAHPPEICYRGQGWRVESLDALDVEIGGRLRTVGELLISRGEQRLLVWSWYRVGGEETESWWREQWLAIGARLAGRDERVALLRFSTPLRDRDVRAGRRTLARFLADVLPPIEAALAAPADGAGAKEAGR